MDYKTIIDEQINVLRHLKDNLDLSTEEKHTHCNIARTILELVALADRLQVVKD